MDGNLLSMRWSDLSIDWPIGSESDQSGRGNSATYFPRNEAINLADTIELGGGRKRMRTKIEAVFNTVPTMRNSQLRALLYAPRNASGHVIGIAVSFKLRVRAKGSASRGRSTLLLLHSHSR